VRRTILAEISTGTLDSVHRTNGDEGEVLYDVDYTLLGRSRNMTVGLDGKLLDIQVFLDDIPFAARAAIKSLSQGGRLGDITKNIDLYGGFSYEVELTRDGINRAFAVDDDGALLFAQVPLQETPPAVQKTISAKTAGSTLDEIRKTMDLDQVSFEVAITKAGRRRSFSVSTNGELIEEQVFAEEIPQAVRKAIQSQAGRGTPGKINMSTDQGSVYYQVVIKAATGPCRVTFLPDGTLVSEEQDIEIAALPAPVKIALHPLQLAGEQVSDILRASQGGNITYDIELHKGPSHRNLTFAPDGAMLPP
jgi:hypothetical protein